MNRAAAVTDVFAALADPTRRSIFERLTRGEAGVKELTAHFAVSQPAVSQHLAVLRRCRLVVERREGRRTFYSVDGRGLRPLVVWLELYQAFWLDRLPKLKALCAEMPE